jgi:hypothetical protein
MAELLTSNDLARIRSGLHPRLPFAQGLRTDDAAARAALAQARKLVGSPAALRAGIRHVLVYGDRAVVVTRGAEGDGRFVVERENGAWVVAAQDQPTARERQVAGRMSEIRAVRAAHLCTGACRQVRVS